MDNKEFDLSKFPIESYPVKDLKPYKNNAKIHTEAQVSRIAKSIEEFGWQTVLIINEDGELIAGHGRRLAAIKLGVENVPVRIVKGLTKEQEKALRIVDNKAGEAEHDVEVLTRELNTLLGSDYSMDGLMDERELKFLTEDIGSIDTDALVDDISAEVEAGASETEKKISENEEETVPISKAFGFSNIKGSQVRALTLFIAHIEGITGKEGVDALIAHAESIIGN